MAMLEGKHPLEGSGNARRDRIYSLAICEEQE